MNQTQLTTLVTSNLKAQIAGIEILPINIYGAPGAGKSATVKAAVNNIDSHLISINVGTKNISFWTGLPEFNQLDSMHKYSISGSKPIGTSWSAPELIVHANLLAEKYGSVVIALEDFHEADRSTLKVMYEFLLERKLGDIRLHPAVALIATMNDSEEANGGTMNSAIKSRFSLVNYILDKDFWIEEFGNKLNMYVSSFVRNYPQFIMEDQTTDLEASASVRSWSYFSNTLDQLNDEFINQNSKDLALQFVSNECAEAFKKHVNYITKIDFESLLKHHELVNLDEKDILDRIIYSYIINYTHTIKHAAYIIELINLNKDDDMFIGYIVTQMYYKYLEQIAGNTITLAQQIILDKLLNLDTTLSILPVKDIEFYKTINFIDSKALISRAAKLMI